jgi:hypothetical protein
MHMVGTIQGKGMMCFIFVLEVNNAIVESGSETAECTPVWMDFEDIVDGIACVAPNTILLESSFAPVIHAFERKGPVKYYSEVVKDDVYSTGLGHLMRTGMSTIPFSRNRPFVPFVHRLRSGAGHMDITASKQLGWLRARFSSTEQAAAADISVVSTSCHVSDDRPPSEPLEMGHGGDDGDSSTRPGSSQESAGSNDNQHGP